jgi:hypothetical protein
MMRAMRDARCAMRDATDARSAMRDAARCTGIPLPGTSGLRLEATST